MKLLVDTQVWLWLAGDPARISPQAVAALIDPANDVFVSTAVMWEIVIKNGRGKLTLPEPPETFIPSRLRFFGHLAYPILQAHVLAVAGLPAIHRDPFDRILIAQAMADDLTLVTADATVQEYGAKILAA